MRIPKVPSIPIHKPTSTATARTAGTIDAEKLAGAIFEVLAHPKPAIVKKLRVGLNRKIVSRLEKLPLKAFVQESLGIIAKSLNMPIELRPATIINDYNDDISFDFASYTLNICQHFLRKPRKKIFAGLRHEMEHTRQCLAIIRTEGLGETAIKDYSRILTEIETDNFVAEFKNMPMKEVMKLRASGEISEKELQEIRQIKAAAKQGANALRKHTEDMYIRNRPKYVKFWQEIQHNAKASMGTIKSGSKEARDAEQYYKGSLEAAGKFKPEIYWKSKHEREAYLAEFWASIEYNLASKK